MNETITDCIIVGFFVLCFYKGVSRRPAKVTHVQLPDNNMERQKAYLISRIRSMKSVDEILFYKWEIHAFVNRFIYHDGIAGAKEELKEELQMQVNFLSIPTLQSL